MSAASATVASTGSFDSNTATIDDYDDNDNTPTATTASHLTAHYWRHWLCFATMGALNNVHYAIILASAYSLASAFSALPLIGLIQWATVILAIVAKLANGLYLLSTRADHRVWLSCMACMLGLSVLSLAVTLDIGYWLALVAICVVGGYGAMCESVVLAYLTHFPPSSRLAMLSAWGAGTGVSGVSGTFVYLLLHGVCGLDNRSIYLLIAPACLVYMAAFNYIHTTANIHPTSAAGHSLTSTDHLSVHLLSEQATASTSHTATTTANTEAEHTDSSDRSKRTWSRWSHALTIGRHVRSVAVQLALVYLFEFVILVGLASQANPQSGGSGWWYVNAYEVLSFCYQLGVLISRSSISLVQLNLQQLPLLTLLQAANAAIWTIQAYRGLMPLWLQFTHMLFVGLLGGAMYVNVFYVLNGDPLLSDGKDRELAINLVTAAYNVGLVGASVVEIVLLNTVLTRQR